MSSTPLTPHGFVPVRGRGYRAPQVDAYVAVLSGERDDALEHAAGLAALVEELEGEVERLREVAAALPPQTYDALGERAMRILALSEEQSAELHTTAHADSGSLTGAAEEAARATRDAARDRADALHAEADAHEERVLGEARATAEALTAEATRDSEEQRAVSRAVIAQARRRTTDLLADQEKDHTERTEAVEQDIAARAAAQQAEHADLTGRADGTLADARRAFADTEEAARHSDEDARARAEEIVAQARMTAERVSRETDRILRDHTERREEMRARMDHVRTSLASLTGRTPEEEEAAAESTTDA